MRDWNPPKEDYADILVSELLGSFGDNELRQGIKKKRNSEDRFALVVKDGQIKLPFEVASRLKIKLTWATGAL